MTSLGQFDQMWSKENSIRVRLGGIISFTTIS